MPFYRSYFFLIPPGLGQGNTQAIGEELSVGKTRQGIVVDHLPDRFFGLTSSPMTVYSE
jgi:hypothetical protein